LFAFSSDSILVIIITFSASNFFNSSTLERPRDIIYIIFSIYIFLSFRRCITFISAFKRSVRIRWCSFSAAFSSDSCFECWVAIRRIWTEVTSKTSQSAMFRQMHRTHRPKPSGEFLYEDRSSLLQEEQNGILIRLKEISWRKAFLRIIEDFFCCLQM